MTGTPGGATGEASVGGRSGATTPDATAGSGAAAAPLRWLQLAVVLATVVVFIPAYSAGWVWDDEPNFIRNDHWRGLGLAQLGWMWTTTWMGHYQPLSWMTLGANWVLGGHDPTGYHVVNVLLHAASSALLVPLLARLAPAAGRVGWVAGALFFAIHPLRVESVVWLTERRDVLAMVFALGTLTAWLRWVDTGRKSAWALALLLYVLSLLSKAHAVTLPVVLLLLDAWPLQRLRPARGALLEKLPFFAAAALCGGLAVYAQSASGAFHAVDDRGLGERLATAAYGASLYPGEFLAPLALSPSHHANEVSRVSTAVTVGALCAITMVVVALRRRTAGPLVAWTTYLVVLAPVSGLLQSGTQACADRYTYFSGLSFAFLVAAGVGAAVAWRRWLAVGVAAWLVALGVATWRYAAVWGDSLTLWSYGATVSPDDPIITTNLAAALEDVGRLEQAVEMAAHTVEVSPEERAGYRYGRLLHRVGRDEEAEKVLLRIPAGAEFRPRAACLVARIREARGDAEGAERARAAAGRDCAEVEKGR